MKKKRIIGLTLLLAIIMLTAIVASVTLIKTGDRQKTYTLPSSLRDKVSEETKGMDVEQIIDYSLSLSAQELRFTALNDIPGGKANCIGYAQLCAAICNQALAANGINGRAKPVVGYVKSIGINWCEVFKSIAPEENFKNFVKDHDFVELDTPTRTYYFDASFYDVLGKKCLKNETRL